MLNQLSRLQFDDRSLVARVTSLNINCKHDGIRVKTAVDGELILDCADNDLPDIEYCLGSMVGMSSSTLYYMDTVYRITITSISWGVPVESYMCKFVATPQQPTYDNVEPEDDTLCIRASNLVEKYLNFIPSVTYPSPSWLPGACGDDDVAAVVAGSKPAAIVYEKDVNELTALLCREACARGMRVQSVENFSRSRSVVVGNVYNVQQIVQIIKQAVRDNEVNAYYYWRLGELLGHPEIVLQDFANNIKDFRFNGIETVE